MAAASPFAQQQPPPTPPAQNPPSPQSPLTFRSRIDSVSVDVSVTDKQGRPVTDLKAEDFELRESKQLQAIEAFKFIRIDDQPDVPAPDVLTPEAHAREIVREDTRLIVVFLDDYHVRKINSLRLRQQLALFLSTLSTHDLVGVMYPLTPPSALTFTYDHDAIADAVVHFEGRKYDYTPRNAIEAQYQMFAPEQIEQIRNSTVIDALSRACAYLGTLRDGPKTLLYVSEGMSGRLAAGAMTTGSLLGGRASQPMINSDLNSGQLMTDLTRVFQDAGRSNTSIYTLDARGLGDTEFGMADRVNPELDRAVLNESMDVLRTIASQTDGRAIVNHNDPMPSLRQMLSDTSAYYLLGYTTKATHDGKFHPIEVRVKRKDVEVRARRGFWARTEDEVARATAPAKPAAPRELTDAIEALDAVVDASPRQPVRVWMGAVNRDGATQRVTLAWETTAATQPEDAMDAVDHISIVATSITGNELFTGVVARDPQGGRPSGVVAFDAPPGGVAVKVTVENARGQRLDTMDESFDVPNLAAGGPVITPPFVYRGRTVRDLQQIRAAATPMPAIARAFVRSERLLFRFQVLPPAAAVTMRLLNQQGSAMAALPAPVKLADGSYEAELGLSSLAPATYLIEIAADAAGTKTRRLIAIRVTGS
jgi:VWFA-related protein